MGPNWREWNKNDVIYGIVVPAVVVLFIVGISQIGSVLGFGYYSALTGIVMEIAELVLLVAIPLLLGLVWNRWAGGASGFLLGTLYALYWANQYTNFSITGFQASPGAVLLGYIVSAMLIGYMAGALNKRSDDFRRMLISGVIATFIGGAMLFGIFQFSPTNVVTGIEGFLFTVLLRLLCGALIPAVAKVFFWYGAGVNKKTRTSEQPLP